MVHIFSPSAGRSQRIGQMVSGLTLSMFLLVLAGCASMPPPDGAMNLAQAQLQAARDAGAGDYDPVDLDFAQNKFQLAQAAMANRKYEEAANLAEEAQADAELARAKARLGNARAQIQAKVEANTRLRQQIEQPASSAPATLQDMPAPSSSVLSAPLPQPAPQQAPQQAPQAAPPQDGQGFQSVPEAGSQAGGQP